VDSFQGFSNEWSLTASSQLALSRIIRCLANESNRLIIHRDVWVHFMKVSALAWYSRWSFEGRCVRETLVNRIIERFDGCKWGCSSDRRVRRMERMFQWLRDWLFQHLQFYRFEFYLSQRKLCALEEVFATPTVHSKYERRTFLRIVLWSRFRIFEIEVNSAGFQVLIIFL
jgi:hypothetical protein